ncbi:MAG: glycoside hydrolase family 2 TIM barrel-domain containing protein [Phycisphaerae bacterium]|jgi:beta-mannosidase
MTKYFSLASLDWKLAGFNPFEWNLDEYINISTHSRAEIPAIPIQVPGSVQTALLNAGLIEDWTKGLNGRLCEWVENRHWIFQTVMPDEWFKNNKNFSITFLGLDYCGKIRVNSKTVYTFENSHIAHNVNITEYLKEKQNLLEIIFECPPRWLGQFGYTSKMTEWKVRFNYFWDWVSRLVQIGIWDDILLKATDGMEIRETKITTDFDINKKTGILNLETEIQAAPDSHLRICLKKGKEIIKTEEHPVQNQSFLWNGLNIECWQPNGKGKQQLYTLTVELLDSNKTTIDQIEKQIGFKNIKWEKCLNAPPQADPWLCVVNGQKVFIQGLNWTPIRPNFADVKIEDYTRLLKLYKKLGFNMMRVWGGAFLEKECFYNLCDELGIMVWQEFPLSASGGDRYAPDDKDSIKQMTGIAKDFIKRRQHHVSLAVWCGGNELLSAKTEDSPTANLKHPMLKAINKMVKTLDPGRRFVVTMPTGPKFSADSKDFGKGVHWAVNGPWKAVGKISKDWTEYWNGDDSLLRSEVGSPGPCSAEMIRKYKGTCSEMPATIENPLWRRAPWWIDWHEFINENGKEPQNLEEYVKWGQKRQAEALKIAVSACKKRFPACGGIFIWMGHDCFPCPSNTSIIDFEGNPKPAAFAIGEIFTKD